MKKYCVVRHIAKGGKNLPTFEKSFDTMDEAETESLEISKAHPDDLVTIESLESLGEFHAIFWHGDSITRYL